MKLGVATHCVSEKGSETGNGVGGGVRKGRHMLMKVCAGSGEGRRDVSPGADVVSAERSLERIGDDGASQAG